MIKKFLKDHPAHKKIVPKLDTIFLLHPTMFFPVWIMVVVGIISAKLNMHILSLWNTKFSVEIFLVFLGLTLLISAAFVSNQIAEEKNSQVNQKISIIGKHISVDIGKTIANILLILGGLVSILANWMTAIPAVFIYFLWGIVYNHSLLKWKQASIASWLVNSFVGVLLFIIGWILGIENYLHNEMFILTLNTFSYMLPYVLCFSAVSLLTTLQDVTSNDDKDVQTFPSVFQSLTSNFISLLMVSVALYFSLKHADPLASTAILVSLPFFIFSTIRRLNKDIIRAIRYPVFIFNFFSLTYYPWLVVPLLCTYYLSKYYYWHRFGLHYPTFLVDND